MGTPLKHLPVLVLDCQTTGPNPTKGHLLELAWGIVAGPAQPQVRSRLIAQPADASIPARIQALTGIGPDDLDEAVPADLAWAELRAEAAALGPPPWPAVIHYARFERPFLDALSGDGTYLPFGVICTHEIARRLLPGLPRKGLRAVAGYLGHHLDPLKRAGDHARATAAVWWELVERLRTRRGVETLAELETWLQAEKPVRTTRKSFRLPRATRLALPDGPGVYRMLGKDGRVLYAGKATSLKARVNAHFGSLKAAGEKNLELYSQVWDIDTTPTETALEAALLEIEEIRDHRPAYNAALLPASEQVWFADPGLTDLAPLPDRAHRLGPLPSVEVVGPLVALGLKAAWEPPDWWPSKAVVAEGVTEFWSRHGPAEYPLAAWLMRLGGRLGRAGDEDNAPESEAEPESAADDHQWDPAKVAHALEGRLVHLSLLVRRGCWLTRLSEAELAFQTRSGAVRRLTVQAGRVRAHAGQDHSTEVPPPRWVARERIARQASFDRRTYDRLRVLTTELKRLVAGGRPVAVRLAQGPALSGARLARALGRI